MLPLTFHKWLYDKEEPFTALDAELLLSGGWHLERDDEEWFIWRGKPPGITEVYGRESIEIFLNRIKKTLMGYGCFLDY